MLQDIKPSDERNLMVPRIEVRTSRIVLKCSINKPMQIFPSLFFSTLFLSLSVAHIGKKFNYLQQRRYGIVRFIDLILRGPWVSSFSWSRHLDHFTDHCSLITIYCSLCTNRSFCLNSRLQSIDNCAGATPTCNTSTTRSTNVACHFSISFLLFLSLSL